MPPMFFLTSETLQKWMFVFSTGGAEVVKNSLVIGGWWCDRLSLFVSLRFFSMPQLPTYPLRERVGKKRQEEGCFCGRRSGKTCFGLLCTCGFLCLYNFIPNCEGIFLLLLYSGSNYDNSLTSNLDIPIEINGLYIYLHLPLKKIRYSCR